VVVGRAYAGAAARAESATCRCWSRRQSQLASIAPGFLARHDDTLFAAKFIGEAGADAGGVYREAMSMVCRDVMSGEGELCVPTPNARFNVGERRGDRLPVLRRDATLPLSERVLLFEFLGMLIGQAARRDTRLDLDFPLLFWKQLVGDEPTLDDLAEYDAIAYESLRRLSETAEQAARALARPDATGDELDALRDQLVEVVDGLGDESQFVTTLTTGETVTLRRGGAQLRLGASRLRSLVAAVRAFVAESVAVRCSESFGAARHVRRGMARMVSLAMVRAFGGAHFARRVCGESTINLEELRRHTSSHAGKGTVDMLFSVLAKFSNADQRRFVQFVYGQSRLPSSFDNANFSVVRRPTRGEPDKVLPTAGTCDFSIALPRYSSADVMAERLLFAIRNCVAIDTDGSVTSMSDGSQSSEAGAVGDGGSETSMSGSTTGTYSSEEEYEYESEYYSESDVS
jgi:E3 ubiquitin-protein ligase HERC2